MVRINTNDNFILTPKTKVCEIPDTSNFYTLKVNNLKYITLTYNEFYDLNNITSEIYQATLKK
jgi:hypothetical protein